MYLIVYCKKYYYLLLHLYFPLVFRMGGMPLSLIDGRSLVMCLSMSKHWANWQGMLMSSWFMELMLKVKGKLLFYLSLIFLVINHIHSQVFLVYFGLWVVMRIVIVLSQLSLGSVQYKDKTLN